MAEAAVEFLLNNLQQLVVDHVHLIKGVDKEVKNLQEDLALFRDFLIHDSTRRRRKDGHLPQLVREIRDVVYDAEDVIDAFVTRAAEINSKNKLVRAFKGPINLHDIAGKVNIVAKQVNRIFDQARTEFARQNFTDGEPEEAELHHARKDKKVVGLDDEAAKIIEYLNEKTKQLDVISIIGMPGLGKTTLAGKIFHDKKIEYEFPTRIWVYVSQDFSKKAVYLAILRGFTKITDDIIRETDEKLAEMVRSRLEGGKFLIVMDDVWTPADWDKILAALPVRNKDCKVLITSRNEEVARRANRQRNPHKLRFLNHDEGWLLLQYEVFGVEGCHPNLEALGRQIVSQCDRLPLAIVVIGGILVNTGNMGANEDAWEKVSRSVSTYLTEDEQHRMEKIIGLSYDKLPNHLRACFLYFGMFPKDREPGVPVRRLISMWIAEGFIQHKDGIELEETAENYVNDLISRNLVRVNKRRHDGTVKTCHVHDMLRDFCKTEAGSDRENFFQEMKKIGASFEHADVQKFRRLCIHSNVLDFLSLKKLEGPRVRSLVCISQEDINLPLENTTAIPTAFKLLRVLDVKPIKFKKICREMYQLIHLRHIVLSLMSDNTAVLPEAFSKFWNLQTLIIETSSRTINIKADVWKLAQLRNLKTNAAATLPQPGLGGKEGGKLQTLAMIAPKSCTEQVFGRAQNLKTLGIRGQLSLLLVENSRLFSSLKELESLVNLKLLNDPPYGTPLDDKLCRLPLADLFPLNLKSLTLSKTSLNWNYMSILGSLKNLKVLKLKNKAFVGNYWETTSGGFCKLTVLHIGQTDLGYWKASHDQFPKLKSLELYNCEELQEVPIGLVDVPDFQLLDLHRSTRAANSAKKICYAKQKKWEEQGFKNREFKLTIFPPS